MSELIIGGTSGLGLEIARTSVQAGEEVFITGRHDPELAGVEYRAFDLSAGDLPRRIGAFVAALPPIKSLVYAAGYYQEGHLSDLEDNQVDEMLDVCGRGLIFFVKKLLQKQGDLEELVTITSTSQWTPREYEPVYNFAKAGAGQFSNGVSLDPAIKKTLVVGPSGMQTSFWDGLDKDTSNMMPPAWVADEIQDLRSDEYRYRFARILGAYGDLPNRTEIVETRA